MQSLKVPEDTQTILSRGDEVRYEAFLNCHFGRCLESDRLCAFFDVGDLYSIREIRGLPSRRCSSLGKAK